MRLAHMLALGTASTIVAWGFEQTALARDKHECTAASDSGQSLRLDGKLIQARDQLLVCGDPTCPGLVRAACAEWLTDLEKQIPSVILSAHDAGGRDVLGVQVSADGKPLAGAMDGRATPMDPGTHKLRVVGPNGAVVERVVVLHEGEQRRPIDVTLPAAAQTDKPESPASARTSTSTPWAAWGFTIGAGVAWATFGLSR